MPGYGDFMFPPPANETAASLASENAEPKDVGLRDLLRYEVLHCAKCGAETSSLHTINGFGYCDQCAGAVEVAASRRIEDARKECGADGA